MGQCEEEGREMTLDDGAEHGEEALDDAEERAAEEGEEGAVEGEAGEEGETGRQAKAPWHFKVIVVGSVIYLGYRLYQGISWLAHHV